MLITYVWIGYDNYHFQFNTPVVVANNSLVPGSLILKVIAATNKNLG